MLAITLSLPPQRQQRSISIAKTRFKRLAHVIDWWRSTSVRDGARGVPVFLFGTTWARSALWGAKTPWNRVR